MDVYSEVLYIMLLEWGERVMLLQKFWLLTGG